MLERRVGEIGSSSLCGLTFYKEHVTIKMHEMRYVNNMEKNAFADFGK